MFDRAAKTAPIVTALAACAVAGTATAQTFQDQTITAQANIFGSGLAVPPDPGGGGGGTLPPAFSLTAEANRVLTFSGVTGITNCCGGQPHLDSGPDGRGPIGDFTNLNSFGGISGILATDRVMFLTGVFLSDQVPAAPAPSRLDFTSARDFAELAPVLGQTFFIGDGLTGLGTGDVQRFLVPDGATRLFLGFADGFAFQGDPGFYNDNTGSLRVSFTVQAAAVPEPGAFACFFGLMVSGAAWNLRRKQSR